MWLLWDALCSSQWRENSYFFDETFSGLMPSASSVTVIQVFRFAPEKIEKDLTPAERLRFFDFPIIRNFNFLESSMLA